MALQYEKWSPGYWALKNYVRIVDWVIHKKTIVLHPDKLPKNKPILITPNHQNALSDPMSVLLHTPFQPVWLARADIFKNKKVAAILRFLKIMPVYRMRDGKENLGKNEETFATSVKVLKNNGALGLFPEGAHTGKRQMIAHKKAAPRIAFMAEEMSDTPLDIQIVPTGIYYSNYWKFNRSVIIDFGDPIPVSRFLDEHKTNPNAATINMKNAIYNGLAPLVVNIENKTYYDVIDQFSSYYSSYLLHKQKKKNSPANNFLAKRQITASINQMDQNNEGTFGKLEKLTKSYGDLLSRHKLKSWLLDQPASNYIKLALNKIILLVGLPVFLYGFLFNALPFFAIDRFVRRKVKDYAFWSSFFLVLGLVAFPLVYILELLALSSFMPQAWMKVCFMLSLPLSGKVAFNWYILTRKTLGRFRLFYLQLFRRNNLKQLIKNREELFNLLNLSGLKN